MKRRNLFLIVCSLLAFFISCFGVACFGGGKAPSETANLSLTLSDKNINLFVGMDYQLSVTLENNGEGVDNASYTWKTSNPSVATVENGNVTALSVGQTTVEIEAKAFDKTVKESVEVNVVNNERLALSASKITIYSKSSLAGESFENTATVTAEIVKESGAVAPASLVWTTENEWVATVENGVIVGKSIGETKVWATATDENGSTFKSYVKVNVDYPVVEKDVILLIDKNDGMVNGITFADGGSQAVEMVLDVQAKKWMSVKNGALNTETLLSGEREYIVCNDTYGYKITETIVADQVIKTSEEMELFLKNSTGSSTREKYYVLGADLDYRGVPFNTTAGFSGTFNGMGHAMYNVGTFQQYGEWTSLFGSVSGTIKNLALVDVEMPISTDGVLADVLYDGATIDNVFIHVKSARTTDQSGAFCRRVESGNITIENSLVWWEGTSYHRYCGLLFGFGVDSANVSFDNTYIIAEPQSYRNIGGQRDTSGYQAFRAAMLEKNSEIIYTYDEFVAENPMEESSLSRYWDTDSCTIPTLESIMRTLSVESFVRIYNIEGESENIGTAIKGAEAAGKTNASGETTNEDGYVATGSFEFTMESNIGIARFFGNERVTEYTYDANSGKLVLPVESLANVGGKNLPVLIRTTDGKIIIYNASVVDYLFTSADKLSNFLLTMTSENTKGKMFGLGSDIDFTGKQVADRGSILAGDFDGMGHTIYNVTGNSNQFTGMFGTIAGGSVSNLSIVNGTISGTGGLFADVVQDGAVIDNVFIHVLSDSSTGNHGAIARWALGSCSVTNTIVWFDTRSTGASVAGGIFGFGNNASVVDLSGTYVIMDASCANRNIVGQRSDANYVQFRDNMNAINSTVIKTIDEFAAMQKVGKYEESWDKTSCRIYTMKGAINYMSFVTLAKISAKPDVTVTNKINTPLVEIIKASDDASLVSTACTINVASMEGTIETVYVGNVLIANWSVANNVLTLPFNTMMMFAGDVEVLIVTTEKVYQGFATIIERAIKTADGLEWFLTSSEVGDTAGKLYVLLADIDYAGRSDLTKAFAGTFDGRGHTIYNVKSSDDMFHGGLFGELSGTVKNLGVIGEFIEYQGGLLADIITGATIDNVFIRVTADKAGGGYHHGAIARVVTGKSTIKNTVVWNCGSTNQYGGLLFGFGQNATSDTSLENVYVVNESSTRRSIVGNRSDSGYVQFRDAMMKKDSSMIKTLAEFNSAEKTGEFSSVWNTDDYKLYIMESAYQYLSAADQSAIA